MLNLSALFSTLCSIFRSRAALELEHMAQCSAPMLAEPPNTPALIGRDAIRAFWSQA